MNTKALENRLRELGEYAWFWYRRELKILAPMLPEDETLLCVLTGVHEANRKMLAVTDRRLIIIFSGLPGSAEVKVIAKTAVTRYRFEKRLFFSSLCFTAQGEDYRFSNVRRELKELFEWAMESPVPQTQKAEF